MMSHSEATTADEDHRRPAAIRGAGERVNGRRVLEEVVRSFPPDVQERGCRAAFFEHLTALKAVLRFAPPNGGPRNVLDVGAGSGMVSMALARLGYSVWALDTWREYSPDRDNIMGRDSDILALLAGSGVHCIQADITAEPWPVPAEGFNCVLFLGVIEHLHGSPRPVLQRLWNCLRPGGILILATPNFSRLAKRGKVLLGLSGHSDLEAWWNQPPFFGHVREYTTREVRQMLVRAGFHVECVSLTEASAKPLAHAGPLGRRLLVRIYLAATALAPSLRGHMLAIARRPLAVSCGGSGPCA